MKISVVSPLYNKAPHINRTIDSILNQTHQVDEIIIVDDGSTDEGCTIIDNQYSDSRIRIIQQEISVFI